MTRWSTAERWKTTLWLSIDDCCVVSDHILSYNSILSVSVALLKMACAEAAPAEVLKAKDLLRPFLLMCFHVISLGARPDLDWVCFP